MGRVVVLLESFWAAGWLIAALIAYFVIPTLWLESCTNHYGIACILRHLSYGENYRILRNLSGMAKPKQSALEKLKHSCRKNMHDGQLCYGLSGLWSYFRITACSCGYRVSWY